VTTAGDHFSAQIPASALVIAGFHHASVHQWPAFPNIDRECSFYHEVQAALEEKHHEAEERSASRSDVGAYGGDVCIDRIGMGEPAGEPLSG
jgi:hypothetical protein